MIKNIKVKIFDEDTRVDRWLKRQFTALSQNFIEKNLRKGIITVNSKKIKANYKTIVGDIVNIHDYSKTKYFNLNKKISEKYLPIEILKEFKRSIVYQNSHFIIINKWSGILTQGVSKIGISINDIIKKLSKHYNLVHRLDKDTSGLLIIAKNLKVTKLFGKLFKEQAIKKIYVSLCQGIRKYINSIVKLDIKNKTNNNVKTITKYTVIKKNNKISLNLFQPLTGKTHQLRVVSKYLNCPIVGDSKYNLSNKYKLEKLKLNAHYLKFYFNNQEYEFKSILPFHFLDFMNKNDLSIQLDRYINNFL